MRPAMSFLRNSVFLRGGIFLAPAAVASALFAGAVTSCAPQPIIGSVRSLQGSNAVSFVCLGNPTDASPLRTVDDCTHLSDAGRTINDFGVGVGGEGGQGGHTQGTDYLGEVPHLYALVTQTVRGEVAIVDLTAGSAGVLDHDPSTPGNNFLPIGSVPTAIVSTPGGTASFVATAEVSRPALYALPTKAIRPCSVDSTKCNEAAPTISSWPACVLPAPPGAMALVVDPAVAGKVRKSCNATTYDDPGTDSPVGNIDLEGGGRQKIVVALPTLGELAVIDAQTLLESKPGSTDGCIIERVIPLEADVPVEPIPPKPPASACVYPETPVPGPVVTYVPQPSGLSEADGKLYVGDLAAPLIHVIDTSDPCDAVELPPLLPTSAADPTRVVVTSQVSVTPRLTPDFKRYLYAIDVNDKSVMAFDVSDGSLSRSPITINGELNPLQDADRIRFAAAPQTLQMVVRDFPKGGPSKVAPFGTRCNPDPNETPCSDASEACQGVQYRTSTDFTVGAGPLTLRGTFALVGLSTGQLAVIDVDDYDAACRGPIDQSAALGCDPNSLASGLVTVDEQSCNVFLPNTPRAGNYLISNDTTGRHLPGITTYALLYDKNATLVEVKPDTARMHAPTGDKLAVNGVLLTPGTDGLIVDDNGQSQNALRVNLEDPRVHLSDQDWTVTFEGALPGFNTQAGALQLLDQVGGGTRQLVDESSLFCGHGVQSMAAVREELVAKGATGDVDAQARALADRLTITNPLADATNSYWKSAACTFQECSGTFGDDTTPTPGRDIVISEAYEDHLLLEPPAAPDTLVKCCFPTTVSYQVRPGNQWVVAGAIQGFSHHVIADPVTGHCRSSCDPRLERLDGRVRVTTDPQAPQKYLGPEFSFYVTGTGRRDDQFRFTTEGSFTPLRVVMTNSDRLAVQTKSIQFLPSIDHLVLSDGGLEGLLLVNGTLQGDPLQYF